jgi:hypothetical protein
MRPHTIGRVLGTGIRVASRVASQQWPAKSRSATAAQPAASFAAPGRAAGQTVRQVGRATSQGVGGIFRTFRRVGGILWLEVTGSFFLLFAALFIFRLCQNWKTMGPSRYALSAVAAVFLYFGISSFWRARRR